MSSRVHSIVLTRHLVGENINMPRCILCDIIIVTSLNCLMHLELKLKANYQTTNYFRSLYLSLSQCLPGPGYYDVGFPRRPGNHKPPPFLSSAPRRSKQQERRLTACDVGEPRHLVWSFIYLLHVHIFLHNVTLKPEITLRTRLNAFIRSYSNCTSLSK